ncbi:E3 ubiquitin-protein ligase TRIM33-like [Ruditapes philippinarum]|uniref:E3 ubiquitin-protein ligase TRIM33-like n=1 Tax=Ruditapes philippinarum TaxID=129788 RepID=UPI00295A606A|nr:E3 ubiquitin-protein ligase TRIM33-like [Ruditapes philippinarum]XP_060558714.1 E3 ubiquitin-protein ligase TRIM33-like [Ruditapes philippinarum]
MEVAGKRLDIDTESAEGESSLCVSCEVENVKTPACGACRECNEKMCTTCFRYHLRVKLCRNHVFLSLDEFSSLSLCSGLEDVTRCEKHDNEIIKFYCRSHDIAGCGDCIVLGHTSCKPEYINDLAKSFKDGDTYKSIVKRLEDLEKQKTVCEQEIEKGKYECENMNENALKGLREFRTEINKCLDKAEARLLSEMKKLKKENTETQTKIEAVLQSFTSELQEVKQMLDTQLYRDNALFINAVNCKSKLADIEKKYEQSTKDMTLKGFKFVCNDQMLALQESERPVGSLQFCQIECRTKETTKQKFCVGTRVRHPRKTKKMAYTFPGTVTKVTDTTFTVEWDISYTKTTYNIADDNSDKLEII